MGDHHSPLKIMRGADTFTESLFSMRKLDAFAPQSHLLRSIRVRAHEALAKMDQADRDDRLGPGRSRRYPANRERLLFAGYPSLAYLTSVKSESAKSPSKYGLSGP